MNETDVGVDVLCYNMICNTFKSFVSFIDASKEAELITRVYPRKLNLKLMSQF